MRYIETYEVRRMTHSQESRVSSSQDTVPPREENRSNMSAMVNDINSCLRGDMVSNNDLLKVEKMAATSNEDGKNSDSVSPWVGSWAEAIGGALGCRSGKKLESIMKKFLGYASNNVKECYTRPNRAAKLRKCLMDNILFFHLYYQDVHEPGKHSTYLNIMSELVSMYLDMEIKAASRRKERVKKITTRLVASIFVFLDKSEDHLMDAILKAKLINKHNKDVCLPVLGKVVGQIPSPVNEMSYIRFLLIFKLFKKVAQNIEKGKQKSEEVKRINKLAVLKLKPPPNFVEKAKMFTNVLPKIPPKSKKNITHFFMQAKFNLKSACTAFLKSAPEFQTKLNSSASKEVLYSKSLSMDLASKLECNVDSSNTSTDDIWSSLELKSLVESIPVRNLNCEKIDGISKKVKEKIKKKNKKNKGMKSKDKDLEKIRKKKCKKNKILDSCGDTEPILQNKLLDSKKEKAEKIKNRCLKNDTSVMSCESTDESVSLPEMSSTADSMNRDLGVLSNMSSKGLKNMLTCPGSSYSSESRKVCSTGIVLKQEKGSEKDMSGVIDVVAEASVSVSGCEQPSTSTATAVPNFSSRSNICTSAPPPLHPSFSSPSHAPPSHKTLSSASSQIGPLPYMVQHHTSSHVDHTPHHPKRNAESLTLSPTKSSGRTSNSPHVSACSSMPSPRRNLPNICSGLPVGFTPSVPPPPLGHPPPSQHNMKCTCLECYNNHMQYLSGSHSSRYMEHSDVSASFQPPLPSSPAPLRPPLPRSPAPPLPPLPSTPAPPSSAFPMHSMSVPPPSLALFSTIPPPPPPPVLSHHISSHPSLPVMPVRPGHSHTSHLAPSHIPSTHPPQSTPPPPVCPPPTPPPPPSIPPPPTPAPLITSTFPSPFLYSQFSSLPVSHPLPSTQVPSTASLISSASSMNPNSRNPLVVPPNVSSANPPVSHTPPPRSHSLSSPSQCTHLYAPTPPPSCTPTPPSPSCTPPSSPLYSHTRVSQSTSFTPSSTPPLRSANFPSQSSHSRPTHSPALLSPSLTPTSPPPSVHPSNSPSPSLSPSQLPITPPLSLHPPTVSSQSSTSTRSLVVSLPSSNISSQSISPSSPSQSCAVVFSTYTPASPSPSPSLCCSVSPSPSRSSSPCHSPSPSRSPSPSTSSFRRSSSICRSSSPSRSLSPSRSQTPQSSPVSRSQSPSTSPSPSYTPVCLSPHTPNTSPSCIPTPSSPLHVSTSSSPFSVATPASPVRVAMPASPMRVAPPASPMQVAPPASPMRVALPASPLRVATPASPLRVAMPASPLRVATPASPLRVATPASPMRVATPASPMRVATPASPMRVATPTSPLPVAPPTSPMRVAPPASPVRIAPPASPVRVAPPASPVRVAPPASPMRVAPPASPMRVAPPASPMQVSTPASPMRVSTPASPMRVATPASPMQVATPSPVQVATLDPPMHIAAPASPVCVAAPASPVRVAAPASPVRVAAPASPVQVPASASPLPVATPACPLRVVAPASLLRVVTQASPLRLITQAAPLCASAPTSSLRSSTPPTSCSTVSSMHPSVPSSVKLPVFKHSRPTETSSTVPPPIHARSNTPLHLNSLACTSSQSSVSNTVVIVTTISTCTTSVPTSTICSRASSSPSIPSSSSPVCTSISRKSPPPSPVPSDVSSQTDVIACAAINVTLSVASPTQSQSPPSPLTPPIPTPCIVEQPHTTTLILDSTAKVSQSSIELLESQNIEKSKGPCDSSPALLDPVPVIPCFTSSVASSDDRIEEVVAEVEVQAEDETEVEADTLVSQDVEESQESVLTGTNSEQPVCEEVTERVSKMKVTCDSAGESMFLVETEEVYSDECEEVGPDMCMKEKIFEERFSHVNSVIAPLGQMRNTVIATGGSSGSAENTKYLVTSQICKTEVQENEAIASCSVPEKVCLNAVSPRIDSDPLLVSRPMPNETETKAVAYTCDSSIPSVSLIEGCSPANNEDLFQLPMDIGNLEETTSFVPGAARNDELLNEVIAGNHLLFSLQNGFGIMALDVSRQEDPEPDSPAVEEFDERDRASISNLMMYFSGVHAADFSDFGRGRQDYVDPRSILESDDIEEGAEDTSPLSSDPHDKSFNMSNCSIVDHDNREYSRRHTKGEKHPAPGLSARRYIDDLEERDGSDASPSSNVENDSVFSQNTLYSNECIEGRRDRHCHVPESPKMNALGDIHIPRSSTPKRLPDVNFIRSMPNTLDIREDSSAEDSPVKVSESPSSALSRAHLLANRTVEVRLNRDSVPGIIPDVVLDAHKAEGQREQESPKAAPRGMLLDTSVSRGKLGCPYVDSTYHGVSLQAASIPSSIPFPPMTNQIAVGKGVPPVNNFFKCTCSECYTSYLVALSRYASIHPGGAPFPFPWPFRHPHVETHSDKMKSAEKLKSEDEELLRRIEESLAKNRLDEILDSKYKPELDSSLPLKKRLKNITATSKIKSEPTDKWDTHKEDSFPSYPTRPMISIAELEYNEKLFSKHIQRPIKTVMSNNPQRYLPYAYFQQLQESKEVNKFPNELPQYGQYNNNNAEVSSTVDVPSAEVGGEAPLHQFCPVNRKCTAEKNSKLQPSMQQIYFNTTNTSTYTNTISTIKTTNVNNNSLNNRDKNKSSDLKNVTVKVESFPDIKVEPSLVHQHHPTVNSWEYSGRQFKTPAQLKELPAVNYYMGMPVMKYNGSKLESNSLPNTSMSVPNSNSIDELKYGFSQYNKPHALDLSVEDPGNVKGQRNRWRKTSSVGESAPRSRSSKKNSKAQGVCQNSLSSNVNYATEKKIHRKQVSR